MFPRPRTLSFLSIVLLLLGTRLGTAHAQNVILYLKTGDKVGGRIIEENTNRLVLSNSWASALSVPLAQIAQREILVATGTNQPGGTNALVALKAPEPPATPPPLFKYWKGEAEIGLDLIYSSSEQKTYRGRFKLSYEHPYASNSTNFFRNFLDYDLSYGKTIQTVEGVKTTTTSSDRMSGSDKTTVDFDRRWYTYNLAGMGFDRIRSIDFSAEEGPGVGYHLFTTTNLTMNVESGANYQIQYNTDNTHTRDFFLRGAEDITWKLSPRTTFTHKLEFFPRVNFAEFRIRTEATVSYNLWRFVYWNFTVRDSYDTTPAAKVQGNEFEVHSALGAKF